MKTARSSQPVIKFTTSPESPRRILDFLQAHPTGVLATTDFFNKPHAAVIYHHVSSSYEITFVTKSDTKKYENMLKNNNVMLVAYDSFTQTTAQITGTVQEIKDAKQVQKALAHMLKVAEQTSQEGDPPVSKLYAGRYTAFRLHPEIIHMAVFLRPGPSGYDLFETIQFMKDNG